jgi:predicted permease
VLHDLWRDVAFAVRLGRKEPGFALVAVSTLALGIGFNATLFAIATGMGNGPQMADKHRVVQIGSVDAAGEPIGVSFRDFEDWRAAATTFSGMAAFATGAMTLTDRGLAAERYAGVYVTADTFSLVGERPILGRDFQADDDRPGAGPVAIIAASIWRGRYGGAPGIVGRTITINGQPTTVIGVMRDGFRFPLVHDVWQPLAAMPGLRSQARDVRTLEAFGRLAPDRTIAQALSDLSATARALARDYAATNAGVRPRVEAYGGGFDPTNPWNAMLCAVTLVLLIACGNVANLLLARGAHRAGEVAIRASLGATRWRIARQFLVESALIATVAGAAAVVVAALGLRLWLASLPAANWPYWYHFALDARVLAYLSAISGASVLIFGVGPALLVSRANPGERLKSTGRTGAAGAHVQRWTSMLLAAQVALTLALLAGAGLLARTLAAVYRADAIVDTSPVLIAGLDLPPQRYATAAQRAAFYRNLEARIDALPGVDAAAVASGAPFFNAPVWSAAVDGAATAAVPTSSYVAVGRRYFDALGLRPLRGRTFTDLDGAAGHEVVIVNQLFASKYLAGRDPLGVRIRLADPNQPNTDSSWLTIVGVTPTVRQHYAQPIDPVAYVPYRQDPRAGMTLLVRAAAGAAGAAALAPVLREQVRQFDADLPLMDIRPLDWLL